LLAHCARRFVTIPRPPAPALFPYTTLFRSGRAAGFTILESNNVPFVSGDNPNYKVIAGSPIAWSYAEQISKVEAYRPERRFADADRKSTRLNSSHVKISYAVFCLKKKMQKD